MLLSLGKAATSDAMFAELQEATSKDIVRFASAETKVTNADQIRKLVRVVELATSAGVYSLLKLLGLWFIIIS